MVEMEVSIAVMEKSIEMEEAIGVLEDLVEMDAAIGVVEEWVEMEEAGGVEVVWSWLRLRVMYHPHPPTSAWQVEVREITAVSEETLGVDTTLKPTLKPPPNTRTNAK